MVVFHNLILLIFRFISHLFRITLLNFRIIDRCVVRLLRNAENSTNELMVEYSVHLIESVGPYVATKEPEHIKKVDEYVGYLKKFDGKVSNRIRFMILGLLDLSQKKWVKNGDGPKTKDEVEALITLIWEQRKHRQRYQMHATSGSSSVRKDTSLSKVCLFSEETFSKIINVFFR